MAQRIICTLIDCAANGDGDPSEGLGTIRALWDSRIIGLHEQRQGACLHLIQVGGAIDVDSGRPAAVG